MCYLQVDEQQAGSSSPLIKVYCDITSDSMPKGFFGSYRLLGFIGAPLEDKTSDGTKIVPPATTGKLDYDLVSSWIEDCQSHDECSIGSEPSPEGATGIWLVDVQDRCLVQRDWDCRYIALSYVWGDLVAFRSQKTNFPSLKFPGSLNGVMGQMPQVIQDAITFTANVKQQYLWVDSLCIVQDDDTFKERYIPRMHLIYQSSLATIVATAGKDANKGLPGISYPREAPYTPIKFGSRSLEPSLLASCLSCGNQSGKSEPGPSRKAYSPENAYTSPTTRRSGFAPLVGLRKATLSITMMECTFGKKARLVSFLGPAAHTGNVFTKVLCRAIQTGHCLTIPTRSALLPACSQRWGKRSTGNLSVLYQRKALNPSFSGLHLLAAYFGREITPCIIRMLCSAAHPLGVGQHGTHTCTGTHGDKTNSWGKR